MTPEAARYLESATEDLAEAQQIVAIGLAKVAARCAYYAAFHAAEAYIVEKTGRVAKTHRGVRTEFSRLAKDDPFIARSMTTFLPTAYRYKEISDYNIGSDLVVTMAHAQSAIASAVEFLAGVRTALA